MDDQRRAPRFSVSWPLRIGNKTSGRTFNVSTSGIMFLSQSRIDLNIITELEIALAPGRRISCTVRVIREAPTSSSYFAYGASFVAFQGTDRGVLCNILQRMRIHSSEPELPVAQTGQAAKPPGDPATSGSSHPASDQPAQQTPPAVRPADADTGAVTD